MSLIIPRERAAVLVVECQNDLVHKSRIGGKGIGAALAQMVQERNVLPQIGRVLAAARKARVPVLYVNKESKPGLPTTTAPIFRFAARHPILTEGTWGAEIHAALAPVGGDFVIRRCVGVDASCSSELFGILQALQRSVLIIMGVSTNFAVEGTVRGAVNRLFEVIVPEDCCASVPHDLHCFAIERILSLLATISSSDEVAHALATDDTEVAC